jgi:MATE family multidrug resistance protein
MLTLPVMFSLVAEPLAGIVDTAFVERLGAAEAAALGAATVLLSGFIWVFNFLGVGTQTEVAHALGVGESDAARNVFSLATVLSVVLGSAAALGVWVGLGPAAAWMSQDEAVRAGTRAYLEVRLLGLPAALLLLTAFGALRGQQDMRTPLFIASAMSVGNIALDAVLVFGAGPIPALGVAGAAWATVISQLGATVAAMWVVVRRVGFTLEFDPRQVAALFVVGRDMVIRTGSLLFFLVLSTRVALQMGVATGAAHQAIRQMWMLTAFLLDAYAASAQSLVGYFLGADRRDLARRVAIVGCAWGVGTGALLAVLAVLFQGSVEALLVPREAQAAFAGAWPLFAWSQPLSALSFVTDGVHWGAKDYGYLRNAMLVSVAFGIALLFALDPLGMDSLAAVWGVTAMWIAARAALGWIRISPGVGKARLSAVASG